MLASVVVLWSFFGAQTVLTWALWTGLVGAGLTLLVILVLAIVSFFLLR